MYITVDEFIAFGGRDFDEISEFNKVCRKASGFVDYYTQGRLKGYGDVPLEVKLCVFEICELLLEGNEDVLSYASDGVSVKLSEKATQSDKIYEIIRRNLPQKLIYLGVESSEK